MNAISRLGVMLVAAAAALPVTAFAAQQPWGNAVNKAMHPGKPHVTRVQPRVYAQPRYYVPPRGYVQPQVATASAPSAVERRVFSYEPAPVVAHAPVVQDRRVYSYQPAAPSYMAPYRGSGPHRSYENATMKGLGQIR
jgi:hypothetical protein